MLLAASLFMLGLIGLLTRRNLVFTLMCIEIMLNASGLAFVAAGVAMGPAGRAGDVSLHSGDGGRGSVGGAGAACCNSRGIIRRSIAMRRAK